MKRPAILLISIVLALGGGGFWYLNQPAKKIDRTVDRLFDAIEHKKISLTPPGDPRQLISGIFTEKVTVSGIPQISDDRISREVLAKKLKTFHELTTLCEIKELTRSVKVNGSKAEASRSTTMTVAAGPRFKSEETWNLTFELEKSDHWRIIAIQAKKTK
ncbi:MAG: hypothetical protein ACPGJR_11690 [Akkermansiaceae bacterium]